MMLPMNRHCLLCLLVCLASLSQLGNTTQEEVQAVVGGHVRLPCYHNASTSIEFMYMQKTNPTTFINGYHVRGTDKYDEQYRNRTEVDHLKGFVDLFNVSLMDEGEYECIFMEKSKESKTLTLRLTVTANYSEPVMLATPGDGGRGYLITCLSWGGYPNRSLEWTLVPELPATHWTVLNRSSVQDQITMLYNVSWTIYINSSQPFNISCTIGSTVAQLQYPCKPPPQPDEPDMTLIAAFVMVAIVVCGVFIFVMVRMVKAYSVADSPVVEDGTNPTELEVLT